MSKKKFQSEDNPFQQTKPSASEVDKIIYGEVDIPESGRIVAKPLPIMSIWPDPTQPRKILPREVHPGRTINPAQMPGIIEAWLEAIYDTGVDTIPIEEILMGKYHGSDKVNSLSENKDPLVEPFVSLLWLAADIRDTGLKQAVSVVEVRKDEYRLVWGERRWTAYHLLKVFLGDKYANIPAQVTRASAWEIAKAQAAENFHKRQLTAIGIARQFAKLLILARQDTQDPAYDGWDALVVDGGCDRPYYAQVADGNIHRIPKGMGDEFERTLNISVEQMRQYRGLLRLTGDYDIDNALWDLGDELNWAERFMRDISELDLMTIRQILQEADEPDDMFREAVSTLRSDKKTAQEIKNTVTTGNGMQSSTPGTTPQTGNKFKFGDDVITPDGPGRIISTQDNTHLVRLDAGATKRYGDVTLKPKENGASWFNRYVQNVSGGVALVIADLGNDCEIEYADGGRARVQKMYLSEVSKAEYDAAVQRYRDNQNLLNKFVHTHQGVAKVIRNVDFRTVEVQFPDGDTLLYSKVGLETVDKALWEQAVAALADGDIDDEDEQEEDAAPVMKFKVNDRVRVAGMPNGSGTIRYIKPETNVPYGVYLDTSKTTHYYTERELSLLVEETDHDFEPLFKVGDRVRVNAPGAKFKGTVQAIEESRMLGAYAVLSDFTKGIHYYHAHQLTLLTNDDGSDNGNSLPPATPTPSVDNKPREWVGKPALYKETDAYKVPVFVQEFIGSGMLRVTNSSGEQLEVHFSQLEPVESDNTRLSDFMNPDPDADHSHLIGKRVRIEGHGPATVTGVDGTRLRLEYGPGHTGGADVSYVLEVLEDEGAAEAKVIANDEVIVFLRQLGHLTRRDNHVLKLLTLTRNNAIAAHKAGELKEDFAKIRLGVERGIYELLDEFDGILNGIIEEIENQ
jgi:hypothetical protein